MPRWRKVESRKQKKKKEKKGRKMLYTAHKSLRLCTAHRDHVVILRRSSSALVTSSPPRVRRSWQFWTTAAEARSPFARFSLYRGIYISLGTRATRSLKISPFPSTARGPFLLFRTFSYVGARVCTLAVAGRVPPNGNVTNAHNIAATLLARLRSIFSKCFFSSVRSKRKNLCCGCCRISQLRIFFFFYHWK